ncbi:MAG: monovalent cation/H+ antiporter subunit D family protein, partial [Natronomonas sp.]
VGVPPSIGFLGKWYIALGAIRASSWPVAVVVLLSTLLSLAYVARLLERLYFADPEDPSVSDDAHPSGTDSTASRTDGGTSDAGQESLRPDTQAPAEISGGMIALVVVVVAVVVGLGFATDAFQALVDPFVVEVLS